MRFNEQLKANDVVDYVSVNYLYTRCHEVISQMCDPQLKIISEHYPELIEIAKKVGESNGLRTAFLRESDEITTEQD